MPYARAHELNWVEDLEEPPPILAGLIGRSIRPAGAEGVRVPGAKAPGAQPR